MNSFNSAHKPLHEKKDWWKSQTIQFFILVFAGGGIDLVTGFVNGDVTVRAFIIMLLGLVGIGLRLKTTQGLK